MRKTKRAGQLPILVGLLVITVALPIASRLVQRDHGIHSWVATAEEGPTPTCDPNKCSDTLGCTMNRCRSTDPVQINCSFCRPISTESDKYVPGCNDNCNICVNSCKPGDTNVTLTAAKADGTSVDFDSFTGLLTVDSSKGFPENKVILKVNITGGTEIKNVGLKFGDGLAEAWAKYYEGSWHGSTTGLGLSFYDNPTVRNEGNNLAVDLPLKVNFEPDREIKIFAQYYGDIF